MLLILGLRHWYEHLWPEAKDVHISVLIQGLKAWIKLPLMIGLRFLHLCYNLKAIFKGSLIHAFDPWIKTLIWTSLDRGQRCSYQCLNPRSLFHGLSCPYMIGLRFLHLCYNLKAIFKGSLIHAFDPWIKTLIWTCLARGQRCSYECLNPRIKSLD